MHCWACRRSANWKTAPIPFCMFYLWIFEYVCPSIHLCFDFIYIHMVESVCHSFRSNHWVPFVGRKRLSVVRRHIQSFIVCLFNIILHVQSPVIFFERLIVRGSGDPDPGSVILMCIEVLTRISGKHALFQIDPWHVSQSLRIPSALFQFFPQLKLKTPPAGSLFSSENLQIDRAFSLDLYAACCRLLYTVLKHHKRYVLLDRFFIHDVLS